MLLKTSILKGFEHAPRAFNVELLHEASAETTRLFCGQTEDGTRGLGKGPVERREALEPDITVSVRLSSDINVISVQLYPASVEENFESEYHAQARTWLTMTSSTRMSTILPT